MAGAAPKPVGALLPTRAAAQLLRLADNSQRAVIARIAGEDRESRLEGRARCEIVPVLSRIENARFSLQMTLFADAVSGIRFQAARIDNIRARWLGHMLRRGPMASFARNAFFCHRRVLITVARPLHRLYLPGMA